MIREEPSRHAWGTESAPEDEIRRHAGPSSGPSQPPGRGRGRSAEHSDNSRPGGRRARLPRGARSRPRRPLPSASTLPPPRHPPPSSPSGRREGREVRPRCARPPPDAGSPRATNGDRSAAPSRCARIETIAARPVIHGIASISPSHLGHTSASIGESPIRCARREADTAGVRPRGEPPSPSETSGCARCAHDRSESDAQDHACGALHANGSDSAIRTPCVSRVHRATHRRAPADVASPGRVQARTRPRSVATNVKG